ncbi:MAG: flavin reductase [Alphaproteobacteria bacterium]|nr:flavin reductase [Alphaproteobacteria bacterium]
MTGHVDTRGYREALGCFATGVTIVTARTADGELLGITANSFSSVSLSPPWVLFSLNRRAHSFRKFEECDHFAINVLGEEQRELSTTFATPLAEKFSGSNFVSAKSGSPIFPDALAVFDCARRIRHDGGDHVIFVGEVTELHYRPEGRPLLYYRGRYRGLVEDP